MLSSRKVALPAISPEKDDRLRRPHPPMVAMRPVPTRSEVAVNAVTLFELVQVGPPSIRGFEPERDAWDPIWDIVEEWDVLTRLSG